VAICVSIPGLRTRSLNEREHLQVKARRVAHERGVTRASLCSPVLGETAPRPAQDDHYARSDRSTPSGLRQPRRLAKGHPRRRG
jgi:hypothetical protein